jgi:transposase
VEQTGQQRPSYDELAVLVVVLKGELDELRSRVGDLEAENAELKRRVGLTSRNSSKPPSADGPAKPPPKSMRGKSGRRPGKQPGSPGAALSQVAGPDRRVRHFPSVCGGCCRRLTRSKGEAEPVRRQVFDVPEMKVLVTEHELHALACSCGHVTRADAPAGVSAPAVYGPNITTLAAYLSAQHHVPVGRIVEVLADIAGIEVSSGWVTEACKRAEQAVAGANEAIKDAIAEADVAHFDESVTRVNGKNHWMHTAATTTLTAFHIDVHGRGVESIKAFGVLPRFTGVAVHDAYLGYNGFTTCTHALCNAHAVRELTGIGEFDAAARDDGWTQVMIDLLGDAHRWVAAWRRDGHTELPDFKATDLRRRWNETIERALSLHPPRPGKQTPARNLALRLRDRREEFLHFTANFQVAFSNNCAEQAIRMIKIKTKVSGGFRTLAGARTFLAIRGYISTIRKNGLRAAEALRDALLGTPWMPPGYSPT